MNVPRAVLPLLGRKTSLSREMRCCVPRCPVAEPGSRSGCPAAVPRITAVAEELLLPRSGEFGRVEAQHPATAPMGGSLLAALGASLILLLLMHLQAPTKQLKLQLPRKIQRSVPCNAALLLMSLSVPGLGGGTPRPFWSPSEGRAGYHCSRLPQQLSLSRSIHHTKHFGAIIMPSVQRGCGDGALLGDKRHPRHLAIYLAAVINTRWHLRVPPL